MPIPKAKKPRRKNAPVSEAEEGAKDILRAVKKAAAKATPAKKKVEAFTLGERSCREEKGWRQYSKIRDFQTMRAFDEIRLLPVNKHWKLHFLRLRTIHSSANLH